VAKREHPNLILLDLMLPGMDGLEVCRTLKGDAKTASIPIIMLTAKSQETDKVVGLELGADDYVTKPFSPRELMARIKAVLRRLREKDKGPEMLKVGDLVLDFSRIKATVKDRTVELTAKEFALLEFLVRHCDQVVSRAAISAHVWDENHDPFTNVLEVLVRRLRRKIDEGFDLKLIHTLRGAGYRLGV